MALDDNYHASDPYDQVALIYGIFMCERCQAAFDSTSLDPPTRGTLPYHVVGRAAHDAEWTVRADRVLGDHLQVLCPRCSANV